MSIPPNPSPPQLSSNTPSLRSALRSYKNVPEIVGMTNLVQHFHDNEIKKFESLLKRREGKIILEDPFIKLYLSDLLRNIRTQVILSIVPPYTRCSLDFLGRELNNVDVATVESILIPLILQGKIKGSIDQVTNELIMDDVDQVRGAEVERLESMLDLTKKLSSLTSNLNNNIAKSSRDGGMGMSMSSMSMGMGMW